jgi:hypothetical protein
VFVFHQKLFSISSFIASINSPPSWQLFYLFKEGAAMFTMSRPRNAYKATNNKALTIDNCTNNPSGSSGFVYSPLHNPTKEIRLLVLKSKYQSECGSYGHNIECSLRLVPLYLLSITNYEALSYTWGSPEDGVREIRLGGKPFNVRINLWWALDHLRYSDQPRILWIDALCIDQSNDIERGHQVRQMGLVYSEASKVIIWLGLPAANSNAAFEFIADSNAASLDIQAGAYEISNPFHTTNLNAFFALCERGYWSRLWVVQEIVLARELMVRCGPDEATWTAFSRALQGYEYYDRIKSSLPYLFDRQRNDRYYECRLLNLLEACQTSKCADPRDKVYGLLGLANDCGEDELVVDYSKTVYEVYRDVIAFHSSRTRSRQLLSPRRDLDVVRFSQILQKSLQGLLRNNNISPDAEYGRLQATSHHHVQPQLIMATGVYAGRIVETEHPFIKPPPDPLTRLQSNTTGASIPVVDTSIFGLPGAYLKLESPYYSGDNHLLNEFDDSQAVPWLSAELDAVDVESDAETGKAQHSDILSSPAPVSSSSPLSSVSSNPATPLRQPPTATETFLSRFPELTDIDLEKAVDISSKTSYICCKCHNDHQPPSVAHNALSIYRRERRPKGSRISKPTRQSTRPRSRFHALISGEKLPFQQDAKKDTNGIVERTMPLLHNIPDVRQSVPSIITCTPRRRRSNLHPSDPQPPLIGIGPPNSRKGDIVVQFMDCDVAAVIRSTEPPATESTCGDTSGNGSKYYEVVGRALLLTGSENANAAPSAESKAQPRFPSPRHTVRDNVPDQLSCYLDVETLWALTR